jgi:hypothetical protein
VGVWACGRVGVWACGRVGVGGVWAWRRVGVAACSPGCRSPSGKAGRLTYCRQAVPACSPGAVAQAVRRDASLTIGKPSRLALRALQPSGKAGRLTAAFWTFGEGHVGEFSPRRS